MQRAILATLGKSLTDENSGGLCRCRTSISSGGCNALTIELTPLPPHLYQVIFCGHVQSPTQSSSFLPYIAMGLLYYYWLRGRNSLCDRKCGLPCHQHLLHRHRPSTSPMLWPFLHHNRWILSRSYKSDLPRRLWVLPGLNQRRSNNCNLLPYVSMHVVLWSVVTQCASLRGSFSNTCSISKTTYTPFTGSVSERKECCSLAASIRRGRLVVQNHSV
jgi:hypothetical protein